MRSAKTLAILGLTITTLAACETGGLGASKDSPFAPTGTGDAEALDGLEVGDRLMAAGEFELALDAYTRAAVKHGKTADVLTSVGWANIALGRLGQAEKHLRDSLDLDENRPDTWNNLGVLLMERGEYSEAARYFQKAYALDNGESDSIRDNMRLALAKSENPSYDEPQSEYKLVRRGGGDYLIRTTP